MGRGIFEDFHAGSKGNLYSKIATPRLALFRLRKLRRLRQDLIYKQFVYCQPCVCVMRGLAFVFLPVFSVPRTTQAANSVFRQRLPHSFSAFVRAALGYGVLLEPNMALNRSAVIIRFYLFSFPGRARLALR